ncbi:conjugal transfer protein [Oceanobacillus kimchii]|uniref:conjugal transfer protein n=1 Tax=Oceanobacillus kimchii TaxID=746691 RepID=UPI003C77F4F5
MKFFNLFKNKDSTPSEKKIKQPKKTKKTKRETREIRFSRAKVTKYVSLLVFLLIGLSVLFNFIFFSKYQNISNTVAAGEDRIDSKLLEVDETDWHLSDSIVPFTEDFLKDYYNVPRGVEEREERQAKLNQYFVKGFDTSRLEMLDEFDGERNIKSLRYIDTDYTDRFNMNVHFVASYEITEYIVTEKEVTKGKGKKKKTETVKEEEENTISDTVEIVVPVVTDGEGYAVKGNPSLVERNLTADIAAEEIQLEGEEVSSTEKEQLEEFLGEFFTSYGVSDEKLPFMASIEKGLDKMLFHSLAIQNSKIQEDGDYKIIVDVVYQNEETSFNSRFTYYLTLSKEKNNYFINEIKQGGF